MKTKFLIFFLLSYASLFATKRFVKVDGGTGAGTSDGTAWSLSMFKSNFQLVAGDTVFFKAGSVFNSNLPITDNSGVAGSPIVYAKYGTGADPIFDGMTTVTSWTAHPTIAGVYYATLDVPRLQVLTFDGTIKGMGRYPKTGYLPIASHTGLSSITATSIGAIPFNPAGAELVIKKARYILDRHLISSRSSNTLFFSSPTDFGQSNINDITDGNGYFIQGNPGTLTQAGEWYYDAIAKRVYVHFGSDLPSSHVVRASAYQDIIVANNRGYISFNNLDIRGANFHAIDLSYAHHIRVISCSFSNSSIATSCLQGLGYIEMDGLNINNMLSEGISTYEVSNHTITNVTVSNTHQIPGMGRSGDGVGSGISVSGNNILVSKATVTNSGYCGIAFYGSSGDDVGKAGNNVIIENCLVDGYCTNKDDGGGIYGYGNEAQVFAGRKIRNNIVRNGVGNIEGVGTFFGSTPFAVGIYLDNHTSQVNVYNNIVYNSVGAGVFFNSVNNDTLQNNLVFNNEFYQFIALDKVVGEVRNLYIRNNQFVSFDAEQLAMSFELYIPLSDINLIGDISNNTFFRPFGDNNFLRVDNRNGGGRTYVDYSVAGFLAAYGKMQSSTVSAVPIASEANFIPVVNYSATASTYPVSTVKRDVLGNTYNAAISIPAYYGALLIETGVPLGLPPNNSLKIYRKVKVF